jgi:hypothetical protein
MTAPVVIHPDAQLWATGYMRAALAARAETYAANVFVGSAVPTTRQDRMVIFRRDGGPRTDVLRDVARMTVLVWGRSEKECTDLARLVTALLWAAGSVDPVARVDIISGPSPVPDQSGQVQKLIATELTFRGQQDT